MLKVDIYKLRWSFTGLHLRTIPYIHDWKRVIYKWVIAFRYLTPSCNRIAYRTIVDRIHTIICYRLDRYKPIHKSAVPSNVISYLYFVEHCSAVKYLFPFPHLNMPTLSRFCFIIHRCVDNTLPFQNICGLYIVWRHGN